MANESFQLGAEHSAVFLVNGMPSAKKCLTIRVKIAIYLQNSKGNFNLVEISWSGHYY
jgi:hypothetical protein